MKRIKQLIDDHRKCWEYRNTYRIKWRIKRAHKDIPACSFFFIPTIVYNAYPYRQPGTFVFEVFFLHWYFYIGEWCDKEEF